MSFVLVDITHNNFLQRFREIRLDLDFTIEQVKEKLFTVVGSTVGNLELELHTQDQQFKCKLDDNSKILRDYPVRNYDVIHCIDNNPFSWNANRGLEDTSQVPKFMISDEEYDSMPDTYRAWKRRKLEEDPEFKAMWDAKMDRYEASLKYGFDIADEKDIKIGDRCEVSSFKSRGEVRYIGTVEGSRGCWIGVYLDEPVGTNDGSMNGERYFDVPMKYGIFVRPNSIEVGDFPAIDWLDELDDEPSEL